MTRPIFSSWCRRIRGYPGDGESNRVTPAPPAAMCDPSISIDFRCHRRHNFTKIATTFLSLFSIQLFSLTMIFSNQELRWSSLKMLWNIFFEQDISGFIRESYHKSSFSEIIISQSFLHFLPRGGVIKTELLVGQKVLNKLDLTLSTYSQQ